MSAASSSTTSRARRRCSLFLAGGLRTLEAGDGDAARALIEQETPSLVVLDLMLPGTHGSRSAAGSRAHSDVPVIMVTALGEEADRLAGLEVGADDHLKPFSPRELVARVRAVLRRAYLPRRRRS